MQGLDVQEARDEWGGKNCKDHAKRGADLDVEGEWDGMEVPSGGCRGMTRKL